MDTSSPISAKQISYKFLILFLFAICPILVVYYDDLALPMSVEINGFEPDESISDESVLDVSTACLLKLVCCFIQLCVLYIPTPISLVINRGEEREHQGHDSREMS